ncbi:MAG: hypothetical protein NC406_04455 [Bacteroides sp.]|nr:hypothetical protein [Bacteroides sp.]MCM1095899.1 hypothetical protein [Terasakiella sp.]
MDNTDRLTSAAAEQPQEERMLPQKQAQSAPPAEPGRFVAYAVVSIVLATVSWIIANWNGYVAAMVSALSVVAGFMALRSHRHSVRNTAITAIVAAGVLLVVLVAFIIVIRMGLRSI